MTSWYAHIDGKPVGPLDLQGLSALSAAGQLSASTPVCVVGANQWVRAESDAQVASILAGTGGASRASMDWDIFATAKYHRLFLFSLFGNVVANVLLTAVPLIAEGTRGQEPSVALLVLAPMSLLVALAVTAIGITLTVLMLRAMQTSVAMIVVASILLLAPCINLLTMLVISQAVQRRFKSVGVSVGFLGVRRDTLLAAGFSPPK